MKNLYLGLSLGLVIALILSILPMPDFLAAIRIPWILLFVLYIEYFLPGYFNITALLIIGLFLDVLLSTVIGEHSFALLFVTWIASNKTRRFRFFSMTQQMSLIGIFCCFYQAIISIIDGLLGFNYSLLMPLTNGILTLFLWPWIRILGDSFLLARSNVSYS